MGAVQWVRFQKRCSVKTYGFYLTIVTLTWGILMILFPADAQARAVRVESRATVQVDRTLAYVEPFRIRCEPGMRECKPTRLYVEFRDGSAWVITNRGRGSRFNWEEQVITFRGKRISF